MLRREFLITGLMAPALARAAVLPALSGQGTVFNAINGKTLGGIRLIFKNMEGKGRFAYTTSSNGEFPYEEIKAGHASPTLYKIRIKTGRKNYIESELYALIGGNNSTWRGQIGLIPLRGPGASEGLTYGYFNKHWTDLLESAFFSRERDEANKAPKTKPGAIVQFAHRELKMKLDRSIPADEQLLLETLIRRSVEHLSAGFYTVVNVTIGSMPRKDSRLPFGTICVQKDVSFPRPAVRHRFADQRNKPGNPNEILAARIILDAETIGTLTDGQSQTAEALLQRAVAAAIGWGVVHNCAGISTIDETYGKDGLVDPALNSAYDTAMGLAITGGGSGCYPPGTRFTTGKRIKLKSDATYPLNS